MALGERATLVTELRLDDKLSGGLGKATRGLSGFMKSVAKSRAVAVGLGMCLFPGGSKALPGALRMPPSIPCGSRLTLSHR